MSSQPGSFLPPLDPSGQGGDSKRLLTTVLVVTGMWFAFSALMPKQDQGNEKAADKPAEAVAVQNAASGAMSLSAAPAAAVVENATPNDAPEVKETVRYDVAKATGADAIAVKGGYEAVVSSRGAQLVSFKLDGYADAKQPGHNIDLVAPAHDGAQFLAIRSRGGDVALSADAPYVKTGDMVFERVSENGVKIVRQYKFEPARFAFTHEISFKNESTEKKTLLLDWVATGQERKGERDEGGMFQPPTDALAGACKVGDSREHFTSRDVEKEPKLFTGLAHAAALDRHYFLATLITTDLGAESCSAKPFVVAATGADGKDASTKGFELVVSQAPIVLAPGEVKTMSVPVYAGPKQIGLLKDFGHDVEENIDFGWFGVLSRPMLWVLVKFHGMVGNFGIAIILLTLLMKALTFPLTQKSYVSMQQMKAVAPKLKEIQTKYGHDRTLMGQKQMEFYQQSGINPMAGCLPMLVQMPIWFALYRTLSQAVELYQQPFAFGIVDLTQPDLLLPFGISFLPLIVGALMVWQTAMQPPPDDQPQMKYVMWGMPVMFTFLMLSMASGLSIYMITNSLLTMAQQWYVKRKYAAPTAA